MATTKLIDKYNIELPALSSEKINGNYVILANDDNADNPTNYKIKCNDFKSWINGSNIDVSTSLNTINGQITQLIENNITLSQRIDKLEQENTNLKSRIQILEALLSSSSSTN